MQIIRNEDYLNLSFVPEKLLYRENEISSIRTSIIEPLIGGISGSAIIYGEPGTGKTATAKFISKFSDNLDYIYLNALSFPSLASLLREVVSHFMKVDQVSNYTYGDYLKQLARIQERRGKGIVLIIDECTNLLKEDQVGIYSIMRASEVYSLRLSTVMVSLEDPYIIFMRKRIRSITSYVPVKFGRYSKDELLGILTVRAEKGLVPTAYSESILEMIAESAAKAGSARVAIEMLQKSAYISRHELSDEITPDAVRSAQALINPYFTESKLKGLDEDELSVLLSTAYCLRDGTYASLSNVMKRHLLLSETYGIRKMDRQKFYRVVNHLVAYGLLDSRLEGKGDRKGVEKVLMINDVPLDPLSEKIENILDRKA